MTYNFDPSTPLYNVHTVNGEFVGTLSDAISHPKFNRRISNLCEEIVEHCPIDEATYILSKIDRPLAKLGYKRS